MAKCFGDIGHFLPVLNGLETCIDCCSVMGSTNPTEDGIEMLDALRIIFDGEGDFVQVFIPGKDELEAWYHSSAWKLFQYLKQEWGFSAGQEFILAF